MEPDPISTTAESPIQKLLENVQWTPIERDEDTPEPDDGVIYATHEGVLKIGDFELAVFQTNDGQRLIDEDSLVRFLAGAA